MASLKKAWRRRVGRVTVYQRGGRFWIYYRDHRPVRRPVGTSREEALALTERLAKLRERAHAVRQGHLARIDQLRHMVDRLPPEMRKKAEEELAERYHELKMEKRLERLDGAVAENERRIREMTQDAETAVEKHDYKRMAELLEAAQKLQGHNSKLFAIIERSEHKLEKIAKDLAHKMGEDVQ